MTTAAASHNLPLQLTRFVGRERELAELKTRLREYRLVTLVGPGGSGKTRLAVELAAGISNRYRDGVASVEFAPIREQGLVGAAVATAVGTVEKPGVLTNDKLVAYLKPKELLLLLDNCEHVADAVASVIAPLLRNCPDLRVFATSREPLGIPGEALWWVPSLSLPGTRITPDPRRIASAESVQLFVDRARLQDSTFALTKDNAETIATICRRLDGLPLALELAAALVGALTVDEIAAGLSDRFGLLASPGRAGTSRHETLEKALDWSYELLTPEDAYVFRRLAVFAGTFSLPAVRSVCEDSFTSEAVRGLLSRLVRKSMVQADLPAQGRGRYWLLETLREYAQRKLDRAGEGQATRQRHLQHMVTGVEAAYAVRMSSGAESSIRSLTPDLDNIRVALRFAIDNDIEAGLRLAGAARELWFAAGQTEGRRWLREFLTASPGGTQYRARALCTAGVLATGQQSYDDGLADLTESHRLFKEVGDRQGQAWAAQAIGQLELVVPMNAERARGWLREALALHQATDSQFGVGRATGSLGMCELTAGNFPDGIRQLQRCLEIAESIQDVWGEAFALTFMGWAAMMQDEPELAATHLRAAVRALGRGFDPMLMATAIEGYSGLMVRSDARTALHLAAAGTRLRDQIGNQRARPAVELLERVRASAVKALGPRRVDEEWRRGLQLSAKEASDVVLSGPIAGQPHPSGLSRRELEVVGLVAEGLTSREIASRLYLSERTVENHIEHVLNKLGLQNRTQIAAWVLTELSSPD